jgi:predicted negative regulator of RcsB-dependent stress response
VATHLDDEAELEQLKTWWRDNWVALVGGLVLGFGAIGGWEAYKHWRDGRAETASQMYEELKKHLEAGKAEDAEKIVSRLKSEYAATPYAAAAALAASQTDAQAAKYDAAAAQLGWVVEHAKDPGLVQLARLRQARVLFAQGKHDDALALLGAEAGSFASLYEELRGDISLAKGDRDAARAAYAKALAAAETGAVNKTLLQQKLDDLAEVKSS